MGDHAGSYEHMGDDEVKYVVHEDWSWMHNTGTEDAGALNEGENFYKEEEYHNEVEEYHNKEEEYYNEEEEYNYEAGINFELEYSYTCDSRQQVAIEGGSEPIRSASTGHQAVLVEDASESSKSSQDDKPKLKPKTKKKKGARRQFEHLQEPPLDASSDPGCGGSSKSFHPEDARRMSINLVTSWLQDAALEEHPNDGMPAQHGSIPPQRRPPPRRPPPGADMGAHSSRRSSLLPFPVPQYEYAAQDCGNTPASQCQGYEEDHRMAVSQYECEPLHCGNTPAYDPSGSQYQGYEEDHRVALYDASADKQSIYRPEAKPLDKAWRFMRTAAIGFGTASKVAAVVVKSKTMEMTSLAVPVFQPIITAVLEESKDQLIGPDQGRGRAAPVSYMGGGPGSGPGRGRGRGRGPTMARPMQPMMRPGMPGGPRPGMWPVMRPGMPGGPRPGMRPVMRPGMPGGPRPGMRPVMRPGMPAGPRPVMRPGMRPSVRPGMGPPGNQQAMARGQFRPVGAWPGPPQPATDY